MCGATLQKFSAFVRCKGLSPRVRGNPIADWMNCARMGPIPACAGQPRGVVMKYNETGAYPRVCGATD